MTPDESQALTHGIATAKSYADMILKPPLEQIGGILSDSIGLWRLKNQVRVMLKVKEFLEKQGIETPKKLEPDIVVPLLDAASYSEDETLSDMYASLLAAHADDSRQNEVHPSHAKVLGQMSRQDAYVLDLIDQLQHERYNQQGIKSYANSTTYQDLIEKLGGLDAVINDDDKLHLPINNLKRLGLVMEGEGDGRVVPVPIFISPYGQALLIACHGKDYWRRSIYRCPGS